MKILIVYIYKIIYNFLESENLTNTNRSVILGEFFFKEEYILFAAGLGEFKLRDLNDEINKLLREKGHWEDRILEIGGPNYKVGRRVCKLSTHFH